MSFTNKNIISKTTFSSSFPPSKRVQSVSSNLQEIKVGIWSYIFFLIFEGAFRKWFMPSLATPLLVIRDPIALWLIYATWKKGLLAFNPYTFIITSIGIAAIYTAVFAGHGSLAVALFGARILLVHFPLIFVIAKVFTKEDVIRVGYILLWLSIPMTILVVSQFYSPQSAFVNQGVGGNVDGAGFDGALGYFRPPATFSFTNGTTLFYSLVACYVFFFWFSSLSINKVILVSATISLLAAIPLSISRGLFFQVAVSLLFSFLVIIRKPKYLGRMLIALGGGIILFLFLSQYSFFQTATEAFSSRFDAAGTAEGGLKGTLVDRFLGGMGSALSQSSEMPFWGYGIGMGTNVGSMLLAGNRQFLIAEEEWGRLIGELGPIMGIIIILVRVSLSISIAIECYKRMTKGDILPWMLLSFGIITLAQSGWAQPTSLGFCILIGGLMFAAVRDEAS